MEILGYISKKLAALPVNQGLELITKVKTNMQEMILEPTKKQFLRHRGIIETINDQLKNLCHINYLRHRSVMNFQVNVLSGLIAYIF